MGFKNKESLRYLGIGVLQHLLCFADSYIGLMINAD